MKKPPIPMVDLHLQYQSLKKDIEKALNNENIASAIYYPKGLHQQTAFTEHSTQPSLPITEHISSHCLSLPMYPELSAEQIDHVVNVIKQQIG